MTGGEPVSSPLLLESDRITRRAVVQFVLRSALALVLVGLATFVLASRVASREALHDAEARGEGFAVGVAAPLVGHGLREGRPIAVHRFDRVMRNRLEVGTITHIKVWDTQGHVIWADQPELVGKQFRFPPSVQARLGTTFAVAGNPPDESLQEADDNADAGMYEVYSGAMDANGQPIVLETYWSGDSIDSQYDFVLWRLAPLSLGALAFLIVAIVPLGLSLARRLARSMRERDRMLQHAIRSSELERRRIAQTLHDGVVQDLAGLAYLLPTVTKHAPDVAGGVPVRATLVEATDLVKRDIAKLRELIADVYPPSLDSEGLEPALDELAVWASRDGVRVTVETHGVDRLDQGRARLAYRVVREGLLNVLHHADATRAHVTVQWSRRAGLEVSVLDDGRGGAIVIPDSGSGHVGLRVLHDVVVDLGGRLTVGAGPEGGTELQASLPYQRDREDDVESLISM
jgi:two-component system, NarL family, sensor kinase